jgi:alpha-ribazole phosphatase
MSHVLFVRHAETEMAGRFCGHSDPELNERGRAQAVELAQQLASKTVEAIYCSNLRRALHTAQAIADGRAIPVVMRPALREVHFGDWEGLSWAQIEQSDPVTARRWTEEFPRIAAPGGETFEAFQTRVLEEVGSLIEKQSGPIAVVTHAGVLRVVLQRLANFPETEAWERTRSYGCVFAYDFEETGADK